jgi:Ca2+-binding EF-hand superfamily protein
MNIDQRAMRRVWRLLAAFLLIIALVLYNTAMADGAKAFDPTELLKRAAAEFKAADRDGDNKLSLEEFLTCPTARNRDDAKQQFVKCDLNDRGVVGRGAILELLSPADERGDIGDPMVELEQAALANWHTIADTAGGAPLTRGKWPAKQIARELPHVADVTFEQWDRNHDGEVDAEEANSLLGVAYGLTLPDGRPIRTPSGRVFSWAYFRALDQDKDGLLSRKEFTSGQSEALFDKLDADRDGRLTVEETFVFLWHDTLSNFFLLDRGFDGYMDTDDFLGFGWGASLARRTVRAFDDDGDSQLSFGEFRRTTFANYASEWVRPRRDADEDGRLSWNEFYIEKSPVMIAQSRYFFDRLDLDGDGYLSYAEIEFEADLAKVPPKDLFAARDTDHDEKLVFAEFFSDAKPPDSDASARDRYEMRLAAEENRFLQNDKDGNGSLDLAEFTESQRAVIESAKRQSKVLADRKTMLEGNYYVRKGVLVVNEIAFLAIVWWVVRRTKPRHEEGRR